ncbi:hypothetical protein JZU48_01580, partial [bacterium]|nr:hypothetical protein [bacterium]
MRPAEKAVIELSINGWEARHYFLSPYIVSRLSVGDQSPSASAAGMGLIHALEAAGSLVFHPFRFGRQNY